MERKVLEKYLSTIVWTFSVVAITFIAINLIDNFAPTITGNVVENTSFEEDLIENESFEEINETNETIDVVFVGEVDPWVDNESLEN